MGSERFSTKLARELAELAAELAARMTSAGRATQRCERRAWHGSSLWLYLMAQLRRRKAQVAHIRGLSRVTFAN